MHKFIRYGIFEIMTANYTCGPNFTNIHMQNHPFVCFASLMYCSVIINLLSKGLRCKNICSDKKIDEMIQQQASTDVVILYTSSYLQAPQSPTDIIYSCLYTVYPGIVAVKFLCCRCSSICTSSQLLNKRCISRRIQIHCHSWQSVYQNHWHQLGSCQGRYVTDRRPEAVSTDLST